VDRAEEDNLLAAMAHAVDTGNVEVALGLLTTPQHSFAVGALPPFPLGALELDGATEHPLYPTGLSMAAYFAATRGEVDRTEQLCDAALEAAERLGVRTPSLDCNLLINRSGACSTTGAFAVAAAYGEEAAEIARSAGLDAMAHFALQGAATGYLYAGDPDRALPFAAEAVALARQAAPPLELVLLLNPPLELPLLLVEPPLEPPLELELPGPASPRMSSVRPPHACVARLPQSTRPRKRPGRARGRRM